MRRDYRKYKSDDNSDIDSNRQREWQKQWDRQRKTITNGLASPIVRSKHTNSVKTFNMRKVNEQLDAVMTELSTYAKREPEIYAAMETIMAAKQLVNAYAKRVVDTPHKSGGDSMGGYKDRYEDFENSGAGFSGPRDILQKDKEKRRESELSNEYDRIERDTERRHGLSERDRDDSGRFA